jgi:hypothetical protein
MRTFPILGLLFLAAMAFVPGKSFAQTQNHELGIRFSGLTDLNVIYKRQKAPKTFHRFRIATTTLAYARTTNPDNQDIFNLNLGVAYGVENRVAIADKIHFIHGWEPFVFMSSTFDGTGFFATLNPGIGYVLGFQLDFNKNFYLGLETIPNLSASINTSDFLNSFQVNAGFNSNFVALSLVYCFSTSED